LSKRTALYGTYSQLDNKGNQALSVSGGTPPQTPGAKSQGYEFGMRHAF
jgi:predicted porin